MARRWREGLMELLVAAFYKSLALAGINGHALKCSHHFDRASLWLRWAQQQMMGISCRLLAIKNFN
jgi:hypothetical protein